MLGFSVGKHTINPGLVLSPMSGVTNAAFRRLIRHLNPGAVGLLVSEFISVEAMTRQVRRSLEMMYFREFERPFCIQIFGYDPQRMRDAALMVQDCGADIVDINSGCPAPKVVRNGGGCELMRQPSHLAKILAEVRKAVSIPLTLKFRAGWDDTSRNAVEIARIAEAEGVDAVAVHGRTRAQLYRGLADWQLVQEVVNAVKVPVSGSGDVVDAASAVERAGHGVKGLYIGRGAIANPFIFSDIMNGKVGRVRRTSAECLDVLHLYAQYLADDFHDRKSVGPMKQLVSQFGRGHVWTKVLLRAPTFGDQVQLLERLVVAARSGDGAERAVIAGLPGASGSSEEQVFNEQGTV